MSSFALSNDAQARGTVGVSPLLKARIAGLFYLITTVAGLFYVFVGGNFIVSGDAAATAHNILASESLYREAITANLVAAASYLVVTALLYDLLKPVSKTISLLAAFFSIIGIAIGSLSFLGDAAPLYLLKDAHFLSAFDTSQLEAMARVALKFSGLGYNVALLFFGFYCALLGYLIFNAGYFPRFVGVLMAIAGVSYLVDSFATFLAPAVEARLSFITFGALVGEGVLTLWLLIVGVNVRAWHEKVLAQDSSIGAL